MLSDGAILTSPPVRPATGCILVEARVAAMTSAVPSYFPQFRERDFTGLAPWQGLRPISPDGLPYLGRVRYLENFIVATGHAMLGLSLAPATGRIVADLLSGAILPCPIEALAPERFG